MIRGKKVLLIGCFWFISFLFLYQCKDDFTRLVLVSTNDVMNITAISAKAVGTISDLGEGVKHHGFCWDVGDKPDIAGSKVDLGSKKESGEFTGSLSDLSPNQKYYIRAYASDGSTTFYGNTKSFYTQDFTTPVVQTGTAAELTPTSASVSGNIIDLGNGIETVSQHGHCWSTGPSPTTANDKTELGSTTSTGEFFSPLSGLEDSTNYYVRAYATNEKGTAYGSVISFTTPGYLPVISGDTLENLTQTSVRIISNLIYLGPDNIVTHHGHCWANHDQPGISDNTTDLGSTTATGSFFSTLSDLTEGEIYYATSYATNSYGTAYGAVIPFVAGDPALNFLDDPNLVAYFPFSGSDEDFGPLGIDGTIYGAIFTTDRNGISNSALSFDGVNDYVDCGTNTRNITNKATFSAWIQTTTSSLGFIVINYDGAHGLYIAAGASGYLTMGGRDGSGDFLGVGASSTKINDGYWHHVAGTVDVNTWHLWVDGNMEGTLVTQTPNPDLISSHPFIIGYFMKDADYFYEGKVDDVLIFNRALNSGEIAILSTSK